MDEHTRESERAPSSPIVEQRAGILFMIFLLVISGLTATVVGYRVKSADRERKAQLLATYNALGGSFEKLHQLGATMYSEALPPEKATFILVYEINARARSHGLYRVLETTPAPAMEASIKALYGVKATESARSTQDAWRAHSESPVPVGTNPKAARFARQYDRYIARDTEVKLFAYLRDHQSAIAPGIQGAQ